MDTTPSLNMIIECRSRCYESGVVVVGRWGPAHTGSPRPGKEWWWRPSAQIHIPPRLRGGVSGTEDGLYTLPVLQNADVLLLHCPRISRRSPLEHPCENRAPPPVSCHGHHDDGSDGEENANESGVNAVKRAFSNEGNESAGADRFLDRTVPCHRL